MEQLNCKKSATTEITIGVSASLITVLVPVPNFGLGAVAFAGASCKDKSGAATGASLWYYYAL